MSVLTPYILVIWFHIGYRGGAMDHIEFPNKVTCMETAAAIQHQDQYVNAICVPKWNGKGN